MKRVWLASGEDCLNNFWRDQRQSENAAKVRIVDLLGLGEFSRVGVLTVFKHLPPAMCPDNGLDQCAVKTKQPVGVESAETEQGA